MNNLSSLIMKLEDLREHWGDLPTPFDICVDTDGNGDGTLFFEMEQDEGEFYIESVVENDERGPFAIIMSPGIDGNFADVYAESCAEARRHALQLIGPANKSLLPNC